MEKAALRFKRRVGGALEIKLEQWTDYSWKNKAGKEYRVKFHDSEDFLFTYIEKPAVDRLLSVGDWKLEQDLQYKFIPYVYSKNNEYVARFPEKGARKNYGLYCTNRELFERLKVNKFVFFNPDDDFTKIHFLELLDEDELLYLRKKHDLELLVLDGLSSQYDTYFKVDDGRILMLLNEYQGELFMSLEEVYALRKMEQGQNKIPSTGQVR